MTDPEKLFFEAVDIMRELRIKNVRFKEWGEAVEWAGQEIERLRGIEHRLNRLTADARQQKPQ
jgi:hypothetical protein